MSDYIDFGALLNVIVAGVIIGAGLPALFALGVRILAKPSMVAAAAAGVDSTTAPSVRPGAARIVAASACFAVIVGAIAYGVWLIASGGH